MIESKPEDEEIMVIKEEKKRLAQGLCANITE